MTLKNATILIVDDDSDVLTAVRLLLKTEVKEVIANNNPENLENILSKHSIDLLLLDMNFKASINTGNEGIFWLNKIKKKYPNLPVIMITAYADIDLAIRSLKEGANDFIVKPWQNAKLKETIYSILAENTKAKKKITTSSITNILGESTIMQDLFKKMEKIAPTDANILILGENGTGKDLVASAIHQKSLRKNASFVKVDIGSLTDSIFESELFGYKKGAFTDAKEDRDGKIGVADKGTLFLDEIGNISLNQQAKLLTVLQNRVITPLGSINAIPIDIRLLSATNVSIQQLADESKYRKDLIYRLNTVELFVAPLRERENDVLLLANHFLNVYSEKYQKGTITLSGTAERKLRQYSFPGNVRELQYIIERSVIMTDGAILNDDDIVFSPIEQQVEIQNSNSSNLNDMEKNTILKVIDKYNGNISKAAKELGITRTSLYRRISKYEL